MVGWECGVGTALSRRIDGVDGPEGSMGWMDQKDRWGGWSVTVWGGIRYHHRTALPVVLANRNNVFRNYIIPFFNQHRDMLTFQKDNARANNNVPLFEWPALSPDLSPREHLWDYFGQRVSRIPHMNNLRNWKTHYNSSGMLLPRTLFAELSG